MNSSYNDFFKAAKKVRKGEPSRGKSKSSAASTQPKAKKSLKDYSEAELRRIFRVRPQRQRKATFPFAGMALVGGLCAVLGWWTVDPELPQRVGNLLGVDGLEVNLFGEVVAQEKAKKESKEQPKIQDNASNGASPQTSPNGEGNSKTEGKAEGAKVAQGELPEHLIRLQQRSDELDLRERELNQLEEELGKQRVELEERIKKLELVREQIATTLKDRIDVDQDRVNKLVETYSGMKPKQAAEILGQLDEDLAVEILGKMKKKSAAEILNLLEPQKARSLSEKFAGYR